MAWQRRSRNIRTKFYVRTCPLQSWCAENVSISRAPNTNKRIAHTWSNLNIVITTNAASSTWVLQWAHVTMLSLIAWTHTDNCRDMEATSLWGRFPTRYSPCRICKWSVVSAFFWGSSFYSFFSVWHFFFLSKFAFLSLCSPCFVVQLDLFSNQLTGTVPDWLGQLSDLEVSISLIGRDFGHNGLRSKSFCSHMSMACEYLTVNRCLAIAYANILGYLLSHFWLHKCNLPQDKNRSPPHTHHFFTEDAGHWI